MSIDVLFELQHEVRRLFIAGSGMAAGDLRLQKMLPQLQKLGESAPVFTRMAQAVSQVLEAETSSSAGKLLELGTLLNSVLYTQGKTETKEDLVPVEGTEIVLATSIPYRKLQPLIEALTQKGQGRMEQLRLGYDEKLFHDFRVIPAAVSALDDSYAEIPDFLHRKVLPALGTAALPALQQQLKLDGGKGDARRLELIHALLPASEKLDLLLQAAAGTEVRSMAIELLGDYPDQEDFMLEQADDKKKEIRKAALFALSRLGTEQAIARLYKALNSKDQDIAIEPIQNCRANDLTLRIIRHATETLEQIVQRTNIADSAQLLMADIRSLQGKRVPEVVNLLETLLSTPGFIVPETEAVQEAAADLLLQLDLPEANRFAVMLHEAFNRKFIGYSLRAAIKILPPEDVYERFCHDLKDKKQPAAKELLRVLHEVTPSLHNQVHEHVTSPDFGEWDPRWVHLFVKLDEEELVCRFAREPDPKVTDYLVKKCEERPNFNATKTTHLLLILFRQNYADTPKLLMDILEKAGNKQFYYLDRIQLTLLSLLPRSYADRLSQFAEGLSYQGMKTQLLDIAETIAAKPEQANHLETEEKGQGLWGWIRSKMS
ncbi:HEAT repeat domain-containing protein [Paenibacillus aceris]|uniref:HEAT repeat protein n=1 Tax=Paenibacillus aceris TaxID=869555 RepID=A0ABS4HYK7_9BACL|nr:HEAT repeat domain-containing protein [Paenibacillus aceris]MBP1963754.1 HEAT repeat protein [Paenibacillus aceris]NHW37010.1 HEAT repeat domain-containing protein [Paenibacillus aceris]